jgi:hypothetical protein
MRWKAPREAMEDVADHLNGQDQDGQSSLEEAHPDRLPESAENRGISISDCE